MIDVNSDGGVKLLCDAVNGCVSNMRQFGGSFTEWFLYVACDNDDRRMACSYAIERIGAHKKLFGNRCRVFFCVDNDRIMRSRTMDRDCEMMRMLFPGVEVKLY